MNNIVSVKLDSRYASTLGVWQYDYGQVLRITGPELPPAVEVQFSLTEKSGETLSRVGTTVDGVTEVKIPDELLTHSATSNYRIYAYIYLTDETSGNTKYEITIPVRVRSKPTSPTEDPETDPDLFRETVVAVNASAERAKMAEQNAKESATEAGKYAASASESAVTAEKTKEDALRKVGEKKREAIEAIQNQEETSAGKITTHTDDEIQRIQNQATESKGELEQTITNADASKKELEHSIETAGTSKTALDKSVKLAGTAKTELDTSIREAGTAKTALDESTETAGTVQETLSATVKQAGALDTSLGEEIETGTQLKTDLVASGEKAVQGIRAAGSEQLSKMQAVAEAFTADREQIATNKEDIGSLKEDITALQKHQNVLVGSETGNPIAVDDAFAAPLCGLTVYGRSTQDGTPTPDAPVPIVSAGDSGSVAVKLTGANVLEGTKLGVKSTVYGITYTTYENGILITGTATNTFTIALHEDNKYPLTHGIYYLTTRGLSPSATLNFFFIGKFSSDMQNQKVTVTRDVEFSLRLQILKGATLNTTVQVSLTRNKITAYSPYREQLLILPTPNGLPGIPVTSGGNYMDENRQQWVCDEVDLERGVKVQRVKVKELNPGDKWSYQKLASENNNFQVRMLNADMAKNSVRSICNILPFKNVIWNDSIQNLPKIYANNQEITASFPPSSEYSSLEAFKQLLTNVKSVIYYALATPIETPLTPAEIAAYKALTAYAPDTVVQASDGAGIKLCYQRDVNLVVKNLEDAIASMTTT